LKFITNEGKIFLKIVFFANRRATQIDVNVTDDELGIKWLHLFIKD